MNTLIFNKIRRIQAEQDDAKREELMAQSNDELGQHFMRHPADLEELAFDLFNQAFSDTQNGDLTRSLIEVKTVGLGETDYIEEDLRGLRAYFQGKGGQILSDILRYERALMPREELVAAIDMHADEIVLDFWGRLGKLTTQINDKMRTAPAERLIELVRESIVSGMGTFGSFAVSTLTDDQLDPIFDAVAQRSKGQIRIVGTNIGIRKLANVGLEFGPNVQERIFQSGQIGVYKGYPVVQLENWEDFEGDFVLPDDELWIIGSNAGRVTWYGNTPKVQQLELPSFMRRWETARDVGILLYGAAKGRIGRVVLT